MKAESTVVHIFIYTEYRMIPQK